MRGAAFRWFAVLAIGLGGLAVVLFTASTVDRRPPQVVAYALTQHLAAASDVALTNTSIEITFNEPVDHASAEAAFSIQPRVAGSFSWSGPSMIFTPLQRLPIDTRFEVTVRAGVRDLAGNEMTTDAATFTFVTAGRPDVVATDPARDASDVPLDVAIRLTFSTLMDTASVEAALRIEPRLEHQLRWSGDELQIIPLAPLEPGTRYRVEVGVGAADQGGVHLASAFRLTFETAPPGLSVSTLIPAPDSEGIAVTTPLAIVFDRPLDPDSVSADLLRSEPDIPAALELVAPGWPPDPEAERTVLSLVPSAPLPPNTTFTVSLPAGIQGVDGSVLATPVEWTFTTGTPLASLGNQIVFLTDRGGITNLWAMNPDGTAQRQLSVELEPVTDYAVSPDGRTFVVTDGRRLVAYGADGEGRSVLTDPDHVEFDPAYAPDGTRIAFARVGAEEGEPMGLWERPIDAGDARRFELPDELRPGSPTPASEAPALLRAPRYSPDWSALAFVDVTNARVGILELPRERLATAEVIAVSPPSWRPDSTELLIGAAGAADRPDGVPHPGAAFDPLDLDPRSVADGDALTIVRLPRGATSASALEADGAVLRPVIGPAGRLAYVELDPAAGRSGGRLWLSEGADGSLRPVTAISDARRAVFGPEAGLVVIERSTGLWLLGQDGRLTQLSRDGWAPRWTP